MMNKLVYQNCNLKFAFVDSLSLSDIGYCHCYWDVLQVHVRLKEIITVVLTNGCSSVLGIHPMCILFFPVLLLPALLTLYMEDELLSSPLLVFSMLTVESS